MPTGLKGMRENTTALTLGDRFTGPGSIEASNVRSVDLPKSCALIIETRSWQITEQQTS